ARRREARRPRHVRRRERRTVRAALVRRARRSDPIGPGRATVARRCVPRVHRLDDPRCRGVPARKDRHGAVRAGSEAVVAIAVPAPVLVPARSWRNDLRAIRIVWLRDLIRYWRDKPRMIASVLQPALYLFVFGTGMGAGMRPTGGIDLRVFL